MTSNCSSRIRKAQRTYAHETVWPYPDAVWQPASQHVRGRVSHHVDILVRGRVRQYGRPAI